MKIVPKKNINKMMYMGNPTFDTSCTLCGYSGRYFINHFVNEHSDCEFYYSRPPPEMAEALRTCETKVKRLGKNKFSAFCYFCGETKEMPKQSWLSHISKHTGEYKSQCSSCNLRFHDHKNHKCDKPQVVALHSFSFDHTLKGYMCKICNFVQLTEETVLNHIRVQHSVTLSIAEQCEPVSFLYNFHGHQWDESDDVKKEKEPMPTATPVNPVVFSASEPDEGLFDNDTMKLIKENMSFTADDGSTNKTNEKRSMSDILQKRFMKQNESLTEDQIEIVYKGPEDEPLNQTIDGANADTSMNRSQIKLSTSLVNADVSMDDNNSAKSEEMDIDIDDDQWEDVEEEEEEIEENETLQPQQVNKNYSIARTLHRLLNRTKKPSVPVVAPADKIKSDKKSNETVSPTEASNANEKPDNEPIVDIVENIGCTKRNGQFKFQCFIDCCNFDTKSMPELFAHFEQHEDKQWSGHCKTCATTIYDQPVILEMELKHLNSVHCETDADEASTSTAPTKVLLKLRRLAGDKLSTPTTTEANDEQSDGVKTLVATSTAPTHQTATSSTVKPSTRTAIADATVASVLKPWTAVSAYHSKRPKDVEKMLRRISLCSLYKCMGTNCIFASDDAAKMLEHLKNHEKFAEEQMSTVGAADDTDSWLKCPYCDETCGSCTLIVQHIQSVHANSIYQCNRCFYRSVARFNLYIHSKNCHGDNESEMSIFHCKGDPLHAEKEILIVPAGRTKYLKLVKCAVEDCTASYYILDQLETHMASNAHAKITTLKCPQCPVILHKDMYAKHMTMHGIGCYQCLYCEKSTNVIEQLQLHMAHTHPDKLLFACARVLRKDKKMRNPENIDATVIIRMGNTKITSQIATWPCDFTWEQLTYMNPSLMAWEQNAKDPPAKCKSESSVGGEKAIVKTEPSDSPSKLPARPRRSCVIAAEQAAASGTSTPSPLSTAKLISSRSASGTEAEILPSVTPSPHKVMPSIQAEVDAAADVILKGTGLEGSDLYRCSFENCTVSADTDKVFSGHLMQHSTYKCYHCNKQFGKGLELYYHIQEHGKHRFFCYYCDMTAPLAKMINAHFLDTHKKSKTTVFALNPDKQDMNTDIFVIYPGGTKENKNYGMKLVHRMTEMRANKKYYAPDEVDLLPHQNTFSEVIYCKSCNYNSKVRLNMLRHLSKNGAECLKYKELPITDPINPVPYLDSGEKHFDKMKNLASSSIEATGVTSATIETVCCYVIEDCRFVCGAESCQHRTNSEDLLRVHLHTMHINEKTYNCPHCNKSLCDPDQTIIVEEIIYHMRMHDAKVFKCPKCNFCNGLKSSVDKHIVEAHPRCKDKPIYMTHSNNAVQANGGKNAKTTVKWKCLICKLFCASRSAIQQHITEAHRISSKYKCTYCSYHSDNKGGFADHFATKHPEQNIGFNNYYERVEVTDGVDVTPIWRRDDPNRIKHIRGILVDEVESKRAKIRPFRKTSSSSSIDTNIRLLNVDEVSGSESSSNVSEDSKKKGAKRGTEKKKK